MQYFIVSLSVAQVCSATVELSGAESRPEKLSSSTTALTGFHENINQSPQILLETDFGPVLTHLISTHLLLKVDAPSSSSVNLPSTLTYRRRGTP